MAHFLKHKSKRFFFANKEIFVPVKYYKYNIKY
jgi:hypothetical protein